MTILIGSPNGSGGGGAGSIDLSDLDFGDALVVADDVKEIVGRKPAELSNATPRAAGAPVPGSGTAVSRDDHVHPLDLHANPIILDPAGQAFSYPAVVNDSQFFSEGPDRVVGVPVRYTRNANLQFSVKITSVGPSGTLVRVAIMNDDPSTELASTVVGQVTFPGDVTGWATPAGSVPVVAGRRYWLVYRADSPSTGVQSTINTTLIPMPLSDNVNPNGRTALYRNGSATGSIPTAPFFDYGSASDVFPAIRMRIVS